MGGGRKGSSGRVEGVGECEAKLINRRNGGECRQGQGVKVKERWWGVIEW